MSPGTIDILRKRTRSEGAQGDAILKSSGISRRKSSPEGMVSPSLKGVIMALARYLTEKNFSTGSAASPGAKSGEGDALGAAASPEVPGFVGVSSFRVKKSIFSSAKAE